MIPYSPIRLLDLVFKKALFRQLLLLHTKTVNCFQSLPASCERSRAAKSRTYSYGTPHQSLLTWKDFHTAIIPIGQQSKFDKNEAIIKAIILLFILLSHITTALLSVAVVVVSMASLEQHGI